MPTGPPAPMTAAPHSPAGMNDSSGSFASMTTTKIATPSAIHSNCSMPKLSTRNSPTATQNMPAMPAAMAFFNPFIFPPAAMKQAQPRTPTYQNIPIIPVTFTHTATSTAAATASAVSMSISSSPPRGHGGAAKAGTPRPTLGSALHAVKLSARLAALRKLEGGFSAILHAQLGEQVLDVELDGVVGEPEPLGDLGVGEARRHQRPDLTLAWRQVAGRGRGPAFDPAPCGLREHQLPGVHLPDGGERLLG